MDGSLIYSLGLCLIVVIIHEFMSNQKEKKKSVFVTCLKEETQTNATTLRDLSLKRYLESLIICAVHCFLKSLHDLIILCLVAT